MMNFKKLLRLNRLVPFEELSREHQEILKDSNLKEEYDKIEFWTLPEEWYIKCTKESAPLLSEWREAGLVSRNGYCVNVKGLPKGYWYHERDILPKIPEITLEQFKKYVLCKQT